MSYFIERDQTLSTGYIGASLDESVKHSRERSIAVPDDVVCYPDLFQLPAVLARHEKLPGALAGVNLLAHYGEIAYATVRQPNVAEITRGWLWQYRFPSPYPVSICQSAAHTLLAIAERPDPLVLIDDRWRKLLNCWLRLGEYAPDLNKRLMLIAFGASASDLPASPVVPVVPLHNWSGIDAVLAVIREALYA